MWKLAKSSQVELLAMLRNGADCRWLRARRSDRMLPKWDLDAERDASEFHEGYCGRLLEKALEEVTFVLLRELHN